MNAICHAPKCLVAEFNSPERLREKGWKIEGTDIRCPEHNGQAFQKTYFNLPGHEPMSVGLRGSEKEGLSTERAGLQCSSPSVHGSSGSLEASTVKQDVTKDFQEGEKPSIINPLSDDSLQGGPSPVLIDLNQKVVIGTSKIGDVNTSKEDLARKEPWLISSWMEDSE